MLTTRAQDPNPDSAYASETYRGENAVTVRTVNPARSSDRYWQLRTTGARLRIDGATAEAFRSFETIGVRALLLKGPSIARWLYTDGEPRGYVDCDLLIAPSDVALAEHVLESLGYMRHFDDRSMPAWWREHAAEWVRQQDTVTIDLHRRLPGVGVDADAAWQVLAAQPDHVMVAGHMAPTLELPARAMHVALHAAQHGIAHAQPILDLRRVMAVANDELWVKAAALARALDASDSFVAGVRLTPAGAELADRIRLPRAESVDARLRATSPPPVALGFEQLARANGARARAAILWHKAFPPPLFIRYWDPRASQGFPALLRAYGHRQFWLARHAPPGFRAWLRIRRPSDRTRPPDGNGR